MTKEFISLCLCSLLSVAQGFPNFDRDYMKRDLNKQDYSSDLTKLQMACLEETRVDPDSVLLLKSGNWSKPKFALRDWILCLLVKAGIMTRQGVFMMDEALSKVPIDEKLIVENKIDNCLNTINNRDVPQNVAWLYVKCYNSQNPKKLLLL